MGYWTSITFSQGQQDVANNRTYLVVYLSMNASNGYYAEYTNASGTLTVNGVSYPFTTHFKVNGSSQVIYSAGVWINHEFDGTKRVAASASFNTGIVGTLTTSDYTWLTTIPRASSPTTSKSEITFGESFEILTHRKSTAFTHDVYVMANNDPSTYTKIADKIQTDTSWTLPESWKEYFPTAEVKLLVRVFTFNGSTSLGRIDAPLITVRPTPDMLPDCEISVADETKNFSKYGGFVQGQSKVKITLNNTFKYKAHLRSQSITVDDITYNTGTQIVDATNQLLKIKSKVIDSRNGETVKNTTLEIMPWHQPIIDAVKIERCKADGIEDGNGDFINVSYDVIVSRLNNKNLKSLVIKLSKQETSDETSYNIPLSDYEASGNTIIECSSDYAWNIEIKLKDAFAESIYTQLVGTGFTLMDFHNSGRGMAIGKVSEKSEVLDVNLQTDFRKGFSCRDVKYDLNSEEQQAIKLLTNDNGNIRLGKVLQTLGLRVPIKIEKLGQFEVVKYSDKTCEASCQIRQITPIAMTQVNPYLFRWIGNLILPNELFTSVDNVQVTGHYNAGIFTCGAVAKTDRIQIIYLMQNRGVSANQVPEELPFVRISGRYK
ncbi:MAG: hypothetical protein HXL92_00675 [[Eubacterium] sulci]|nr:hypothetical protein [[Eubacterium] sulci]